MQNLAIGSDATDEQKKKNDSVVKSELEAAGIKVAGPHEFLRRHEIYTAYIGDMCGWGFHRAWYYWVAEGPGIPPDLAQKFHKTWGKEVRVDGHCGCPSPREWFKGFAVGHYHIDTAEGLKAFADLLKEIYVETEEEVPA